MGVSRIKAFLKDAYEFLLEILKLKLLWVVIALFGFVLVMRPNTYEGTIVSRGVSGSAVDMHNQMVPYKDMVKEYTNKTGDAITPALLTSKEVSRIAKNNYRNYPKLTPDQVYSRLLYKPYVLRGQVVMKIRMHDGPDFLEIASGDSIYAIYFIDSLPPQVKGDSIEVTGIVYGSIVSGKTKETAIVSSYKNVVPYVQTSQP